MSEELQGVKEIAQNELQQFINGTDRPLIVFLYTPLCGTCKLAERMLQIVMEMLPELKLYKGNVNFMPKFVQEWEINSVPCLLIMQSNHAIEKIYRLSSVPKLYEILKSM